MKTKCRVLEASASASRPARTMCLSPADKLLDRFYRTMISAEKYLDVTSLSMPSGVFRPAFINALTVLDQKATPPTVRILLSGEEVLNINPRQPAQEALEKIWTEMRKAGNLGETIRMHINMGYVSRNFSWNHSKIIIADKQRMLQGGHNMWGDPYLISRPVSDLSMEVYGPIVGASQSFVDSLWAENVRLKTENLLGGAFFGSLPKGSGEIANPLVPTAASGSIPMIAVGRMGTFGPNPSDDASKAMIRSAKYSIDFIVQDLYGLLSNVKIKDIQILEAKPWAFDEIAEALMRGVHLRVIQSDTDVGVNDYTLFKFYNAQKLLISNVVQYAKEKRFKAPGGQSPQAYFCSLVQYAPIRYVADQTRWDKQKGYGSHAKLLIVDDAAFYVGSHNYYTANLQEFGVIVADQALTRQLQKAYWEPIWNVSQHSVAQCN
ncbi:MAG: phospholipase D-like domain-containing protein [Bdellovibrionota bacterium]